MNVMWVAFGGALGAMARYGVNGWSERALSGIFPWHTFLVNVLGCFTIGVVAELTASRTEISQPVRLFLMTGILGGFTTFSAFALDFAELVERRAMMQAGTYVFGSVACSLVGVFAGLILVRAILL